MRAESLKHLKHAEFAVTITTLVILKNKLTGGGNFIIEVFIQTVGNLENQLA